MTKMIKSYDWYKGVDIQMPRRPLQPCLPPNHTAKDALIYADALHDYELAMEEYQSARNIYQTNINARYDQWREDLRTKFGLCQAEFDIIMEETYYRGHHADLEEVAAIFESLCLFVHKYITCMK